jgi:hypothetical protein
MNNAYNIENRGSSMIKQPEQQTEVVKIRLSSEIKGKIERDAEKQSRTFAGQCRYILEKEYKKEARNAPNKQSTQNYACPRCGVSLSVTEYRTGECHSCCSAISA